MNILNLPMNRITQHFPLWLRTALFVLVLFACPQIANAQEDSPTPVTPVTVNDVNLVAKELWCPLCSGVRLDACELKACEQMRDVIAEQLTDGQDTQQIKDYFVVQYGPQVLGEPPMEGFNWLAWILPVVALIGGGVFAWQRMRGMVSAKPKESAAPSTAPSDEDRQRLEEELKQYD